MTGLTQSREHHILRCTGTLKGTEEQCDRKRTKLVRTPGGETSVCLNKNCNLYTDLSELARFHTYFDDKSAWRITTS